MNIYIRNIMNSFVSTKIKEGMEELSSVIEDDIRFTESKVILHDLVMQRIFDLYIRYIISGNKLIFVYPFLMHPNKRIFLRDLIEKLLGRIVELKREMVMVEYTDYQFMNSILIANKISPMAAKLLIPSYFQKDRKELLDYLYGQISVILEEKAYREKKEAEEREELERQKKKEGARFSMFLTENTSTKPPSRVSQEAVEPSANKETPEEPKEETVKLNRPQFVPKDEMLFEYLTEIQMIQRHERARVSRLIVQAARERQRVEEDKAWHRYKPIPLETQLNAARIIQKAWSDYSRKRKATFNLNENRIMYGTYMRSHRSPCDLQQMMQARDEQQNELKSKVFDAVSTIRAKLELYDKAEIKANMIDEMRDYVQHWYEYTKAYGYAELPKWPTDECLKPSDGPFGIPRGVPKDFKKQNFPELKYKVLGKEIETVCGSEAISAGLWIPVDKYAPAAEQVRRKNKDGGPKPDDKEALQREKEAAMEKAEKERQDEEIRIAELRKIGHIPEKSSFISELQLSYKDYISEYKPFRDFIINPNQEFQKERLEQDIIYQMRKDMRPEIDAVVREDLKVLQAALDTDEGRTTRLGDDKKGKQKGEKKKKKGKKKKDPLAGQSAESLYVELVEDGMVVEPEVVELEKLKASYNHHAAAARAKGEEPFPSIADVYQVANEYITIPLGCKDIKKKSGGNKSVLFVGPDTYTKPLVYGIARASGSLLIYLRPVNFQSRFKTKVLINALIKVCKEYEPAILFAESIDKAFLKKPPQVEGEELGGVKPILGKLLKEIKKSDRVMFVGTAEAPWLAKPPMLKLFDKILPLQETDYHQTSSTLQKAVMNYQGVDRRFNTSVAAFMLLGQTQPEIEDKVNSALAEERITSLKYKPLELEEIGCTDILESRDRNQLPKWYFSNYSLCRQRAKVLREQAALQMRLAALKKGSKA